MRPTLSATVLSSALVLSSGVTASAAEKPALDWKPCATVAAGWNTDDQRSECTTVRVPLDHADPGGRQIDIAVSRLRATGDRTGAILVNG